MLEFAEDLVQMELTESVYVPTYSSLDPSYLRDRVFVSYFRLEMVLLRAFLSHPSSHILLIFMLSLQQPCEIC